jgi:hypothetical protein
MSRPPLHEANRNVERQVTCERFERAESTRWWRYTTNSQSASTHS